MKCEQCKLPNGLGIRKHRGKQFCSKGCTEIYDIVYPQRRTRWWWAVAGASILLLAFAASAKAEDDCTDVKKWYETQLTPDKQSGCCGLGDAPPVQLSKTSTGYEFLWKGQYWPIPQDKIEFVDCTPRGAPTIFFTTDSLIPYVYCAKLLRPRI